jgi:hypothetical protein
MSTMKTILVAAATTAVPALVLLAPVEAQADHLEACGGIFLEASAQCEVVTTETCKQRCEPVACIKVCASRNFTACEGSCSFSAEVECSGTCNESCVPGCEQSGEPPNCMGLCMSDCQQDCNAKCEAIDDQGECRSSCAHCCSANCDGQCEGQEQTTCEPVCETACTASCDARADLDCQIECQSSMFTVCEEQVVQECERECETSGAAIFCDGQFLATGGDLQACADALLEHFDISLDVDIDIDIDGDGDGDDHPCDEVEEISCSASFDPDANGRPIAIGLLVFVLASIWRVRRAYRAG